MLMRALRAERLKLLHSPVWLAFLIVPVIPAVMGTFNYLGNLGILSDDWYSLWTQHGLFLCYFFLPPLIGVYCAYLCRLEHIGHNWYTLLSSPVGPGALYGAKLAAASFMVLLTHCWFGALFVLSGKLAGLPGAPPAALLSWLAAGVLGGMVICAVQLFLSLVIKSFAAPVGAALIGGIGGMLALTQGSGLLFPYSLNSLGMKVYNPLEDAGYPSAAFALSCLLYLLLFAALPICYLRRADI